MLVKKYFIDVEHYSKEDNRIIGDMGFTFCDMAETICDTLEEAKAAALFGIYESLNAYAEGDNDIFIVYEYTFDTDKFERYDDEIDEDYSIYSDAIVNKEIVYGMCSLFDDETFTKLQKIVNCYLDIVCLA